MDAAPDFVVSLSPLDRSGFSGSRFQTKLLALSERKPLSFIVFAAFVAERRVRALASVLLGPQPWKRRNINVAFFSSAIMSQVLWFYSALP